ncbi:hypothetical protein EDD16DRAFT_1707120 [Pisolithus croceorrhizus]|nr:hypothetical protein EV401DRAFT_2083694 [Pisolithus croceorrhizus]KAI6118897.1 hypothetical protein EDD16DRAFT_1707120 [Pisolithus croceorrhizus]
MATQGAVYIPTSSSSLWKPDWGTLLTWRREMVDILGDIYIFQNEASNTDKAVNNIQDAATIESGKESVPGTDNDREVLCEVVATTGGKGDSSNMSICTMGDQATEQSDFAVGNNNRRAVSKEGRTDGEGASSNISIHITDDQAAEQIDFAVGNSAKVALDEGKEKEASDSGFDSHLDMDLDSGSTDEGNGGMSDDDMLGNTFQLMDVKVNLDLARV